MSFATLRKTVCTDIDISTALKEIAANPRIGDALAFDLLDGRHIECVVTDIDDNAIRFDSADCLGDEGLYKQLEWYKDRRHRMKMDEPGGGSVAYWTSSQRSGNSSYFCLVSGDGGASSNTASRTWLSAPVCFRIRKS